MDYNKIKQIAKTMSKEEFIIRYINKEDEDFEENLFFCIDSEDVYACPSEITGDPPCCDNSNCIKCWIEFVNKLYEDIREDK